MTTMTVAELNNSAATAAVLDEYVETMGTLLPDDNALAGAAVRGLRGALLAVSHHPAPVLYDYADRLEGTLLANVGGRTDVEDQAIEATIHTARTLAGIREVAHGGQR